MDKLLLKEKLIIGVIILIGAGIIAFLFATFGITGAVMAAALIITAVLVVFIFRNPEFGWFLIVFFLPFERVPTLNLGGVDLKINIILGFLTLFAWILALMFNPKKFKVRPYAIAIPIILYVLAMLISLTVAGNMTRGVSVLVFTLFTIALSILTVNMVSSRENLKKTLQIIFLSSIIVSIFGLLQFAGSLLGLPDSTVLLKEGYGAKMMGFPRIMAFSQEPLYLANFLLIPITLGLAFFFNKIDVNEDKSPNRLKQVGILLLLILVLILTVSRGAYLGFLASLIVLAIFFFRKIFTWKNVLIFILSVAVLGYAVAFGLSKGDPQATNNFITHVLVRDYAKSASVQERLTSYTYAWIAFKQHPALGIGTGNYGPWLTNFRAEAPKGGWLIVNNEFLEVLAETGLVGLIIFVSLLVILIWRSFIAIKYAADPYLKVVMIGLLAAFIGILVQYNFFSTLYIIHIWVLIGLLVATQSLILIHKGEE
jgi:O-antigen ligase